MTKNKYYVKKYYILRLFNIRAVFTGARNNVVVVTIALHVLQRGFLTRIRDGNRVPAERAAFERRGAAEPDADLRASLPSLHQKDAASRRRRVKRV